jgi:hypothetical protein
MAQIKISALTTGVPKGTDETPAVDTTDVTQAPSGTTKKYIRSDELNFYLQAQGLTTYAAVRVATDIALTVVYANGTAGVGATLTNAGAQAALSIDGVALVVSDRVLVKNQSSTLQNGIYTVTTIGSDITNWVMTRATDYNQPSEIIQFAVVLSDEGADNAGLLWQETAAGPWIIGTTPIVFAQYNVVSTSGSVASITGTANQVLANGVTGTPEIGAVTLTLPQDIGTTSSPTFNALTLTTALTVPNGGTGLQTATAYGLIAGGTTATSAFQSLNTGSSGQLLQSNGTSALPTWTTATFPSGSGTLNHMLRSDGTNWVETTATTLDASDNLAGLTSVRAGNLELIGNSLISTDTNGHINLVPNGSGVTIVGGSSSFTTATGGILQVEAINANAPIAIGAFGAANYSLLNAFKSRSAVIGSFTAVQSGDTLFIQNALGDDGTQFTAACRLTASVGGAVSNGVVPGVWACATASLTGVMTTGWTLDSNQIFTLTHPLAVGSGGLGITTTPSNGQIPIGNGTTYTAATLTAGTGVSITNGSGSVTIASTGGGMTWTTTAGTTQAAAVNNGYISGNAAQTTFTLPATAAIGDKVAVEGLGAGGWILAANTGQTIKIGTSTTSSAGTLTSAAASDNVYVTCIVANLTWRVQTTNSTGLVVA